jgi:hypothetical protein
MFIGKLMISAGTAVAFYCLVTFISSIKATIIEPILLIIVNFIFILDRLSGCLCYLYLVYGGLQYRYGYIISMFHYR